MKHEDFYYSRLDYRYDLFIIWANGLKFKNEIINDIEDNDAFEIIMAQEINVISMKKLIKHIYNFEYAPKVHLISKTKYLNKLPHTIMYVLVKNLYPDEYIEGMGKFQHLESHTIKNFKESIRDKYNDYKDGKRSDNHVIHATDNEQQTDSILKYIRKKGGLKEFQAKQILNVPFHIGVINNFKLMRVKLDDLYARILTDEGNAIIKLCETPQYISLMSNSNAYSEYLKKYQYKRLTKTFRLEKLNNLYKTISEDSYIEYGNYIVVRQIGKDNKLVIADGVHRGAALLAKGYTEVNVVKVISIEKSVLNY